MSFVKLWTWTFIASCISILVCMQCNKYVTCERPISFGQNHQNVFFVITFYQEFYIYKCKSHAKSDNMLKYMITKHCSVEIIK